MFDVIGMVLDGIGWYGVSKLPRVNTRLELSLNSSIVNRTDPYVSESCAKLDRGRLS
jgi:hypothetical protein